MANKVYPKFKEHALGLSMASRAAEATINVRAVLLNTTGTGTTYTYSDAHEFLASIPAAARIAISDIITSKTFLDGVFKAANSKFSAVTGDVSEGVAFFIDTGDAATSRLIAFVDTGITGAPVTPNGGDINLNFDTGANGIFAL